MAKYTVDDIINALGQNVSVSVLKKMILGMKKGSRVYAKILFLQHRNLECRECRQCRECGEELDIAFQKQVLHNHNVENFAYCQDCSCACCTLDDSDPEWVPWIDPCVGCNRLKCPVCGMGCGCKWADKEAHGRLNQTSYPY